MLYFYACLSRSRLCHALLPPPPFWAFSCVVTSAHLVVCLGGNTCENPSRWCRFAQCIPYLHSAWWYACHACIVPLVWLSLLFCIFAHLPTCSRMSPCLLVSFVLQSNGTMDTWSKPTFVLLGHHLLLDNMLVCPFICLACLFALVWLSLFMFLYMLSLSPLLSLFLVC